MALGPSMPAITDGGDADGGEAGSNSAGMADGENDDDERRRAWVPTALAGAGVPPISLNVLTNPKPPPSGPPPKPAIPDAASAGGSGAPARAKGNRGWSGGGVAGAGVPPVSNVLSNPRPPPSHPPPS
mmetsp:Transcript_9261/g.28825  ORF Transcript_9261/g.28825 Transcript_9261/m.28825 type:complete len:128 (-) Transcript_9261:1510-1893(-)